MRAEVARDNASVRREPAMTGNVNGDRPSGDAEQDLTGEQPSQDLHPAIDPREAPSGNSEPAAVAPPLDVDEREGADSSHESSEPIEMPGTHDDLQSEEDDFDTGFTPIDLGDDPDSPGSTDSATVDEVSAASSEESSPGAPPSPGAEPGDERETTSLPPSETAKPATGTNPIAGAAASVSGAFSRFNVGGLFRARDDSANGAADGPGTQEQERDPDAPLPPPRRIDGFRGFLDPRLHMPDLIPHRRFTAAAVIVAVLMLLSNSAGLALIVLGSIVPVLIVMTLTQHDVFEKESNLIVAALAVAGGVAGLLVGWISAWVVSSQWFDTGRLNFGASGFGGRFAEAAGSAPFMVWMVAGLLLPAAAIVGIGAVPVVLRRWPQFRNEVMDGMIMAGASAAGLSIGLGVVYWLPMINGDGPLARVSDWTLMIVGVNILRPLIITLCGAMIGAGVWRYMLSTSSSLAIYPAVAGVVGIFLMVMGSIQLQSTGIWAEFLWTALVAVAAFVLYRRVLDQAVETDRRALGGQEQRMVCPHCHQVTPIGIYCARCGQPLAEQPATGPEGDATPA